MCDYTLQQGPQRSWPKECLRAYRRDKMREHRARFPNRQRCVDYKNRYGISCADYDRMLKAQEGTCRICQNPEPISDGRRLAVDHDHATGEVRGLLCSACNTALGKLKDDPVLLARAIAYLKGTL